MTAHKLSHQGVLFLAEFVTGGVVDVMTVEVVVNDVVVISVDSGKVIGAQGSETVEVKNESSVEVEVDVVVMVDVSVMEVTVSIVEVADFDEVS